MADGSGKEKHDYAAELATLTQEAMDATRAGDLAAAVDRVLKFEKKSRLSNEWEACASAAALVVRLCREAEDWEAACSNLVLLSKRRSQHQRVITAAVKEAMAALGAAVPDGARLRLIETLREVTEGKIYLELERATLTQQLVAIQEGRGDLELAAKTLQEVQVETIGSMSKRDKVTYVLEQMRLTLATKDYIRTKILSNKISRDNIRDGDLQDLKLRYCRLMVEYHKHEDGPDELWRDYEAVFDTPLVQADEAQWRDALSHFVIFLALTEHAIEPYTALEGLRKTHAKKLAALPACDSLSKYLTTQEVIPWPLPHDAELQTHSAFTDSAFWGPAASERWALLRRRVLEHNVRVVAQYYSRTRTAHLAAMLSVEEAVLERTIADMVTGQQKLFARINRPDGIVSFDRPKQVDEVLNDWAADVDSLLHLVERADHLISKERQVHSS